jgi:hypothetical protein
MPELQQHDPLAGLLLTLGLSALAVVVAGLAIGLGIWHVRRRQRGDGRRWAESARTLGLSLGAAEYVVLSSALDGTTTAQPMTGPWAGRQARVWVSRERHSSQTTGTRRFFFHTCCSIGIDGRQGPEFSIVPGKALDGVLGAPGFATGLPSFDRRFRVAGTSPHEIVSMLSRRGADGVTVAARFGQLSGYGWSLAADQGGVAARRRGVIVDASQLRTALDILSDLAARMER